jgi:hypothetical protein
MSFLVEGPDSLISSDGILRGSVIFFASVTVARLWNGIIFYAGLITCKIMYRMRRFIFLLYVFYSFF